MRVRRRERSVGGSSRAQSSVLGIVLLIGMVAAGSIGVLLVAGEGIGQTEQQSEQERVEQAFVELSQQISTATTNNDVTHGSNLEAGEHGAIAHHDSATYEIWAENNSGTTTPIANGTIGTIEYDADDGTRLAYEGGAVFRETGTQTRVLSTPPINYDHRTNTLSFPVVELTENKTIDSGDIAIEQASAYANSMNYIKDDHVFIEIESEYCLGWEQHFTSEAGDTSLQQGCYDAANDDGTLKVRLGYEDIDNAFSKGVALGDESNYDAHQSGGEFDDIGSEQFKPLDGVISEMKADFRENESHIDTGDWSEITAGTYFAAEGSLDAADELTFSLEEGNAVLVVDDDISGYDITVDACGPDGSNQAKIYATGDIDVGNNEFTQTCGDDESNLQLYGTSEMGVDFGNGYVEGLLYAASDKTPGEDGFDGWQVNSNNDKEYQIHLQGSPEFDGSIIAHSISERSNFDDVNEQPMNSSEIEVIPPGYEPAPQLTYLNIAEYEIDVENN
ncbi:DUF7289 family protein [Natrialba taiwanensis]